MGVSKEEIRKVVNDIYKERELEHGNRSNVLSVDQTEIRRVVEGVLAERKIRELKEEINKIDNTWNAEKKGSQIIIVLFIIIATYSLFKAFKPTGSESYLHYITMGISILVGILSSAFLIISKIEKNKKIKEIENIIDNC